MADLDYAFLADYAHVEGGKLSALGASYTHAEVASTNNLWVTSVAGRVRSVVDAPPIDLSIRVVGPGDAYEISTAAVIEVGPEARPYGDGKVGILFAQTFAIPILMPGLFHVQLSIDGELVRTLAFDVSVGP